ncbi:TetR/AcrR family transcriptional regulator C-terminal domain-containing protein [Nocardia sp. NPDC050697]|uniref:TetR/AcrR family transcriptional regulator n=1 Tax=Nocardia sp. NPDC050697 TaxID=3155158 RepID=UPI0033F70C34
MTTRRTEALSRQRIVTAAIEILDADGEQALTFRALAARLATGSGAIYHHVANKTELLSAATEEVVAAVSGDSIPEFALGLFDAIDAHPWAGAHLTREPGQDAMLLVYEGLGGRLPELGVPERAWFDAVTVLANYVVGAAWQNASNAVEAARRRDTDRAALLGAVAERWAARPERFPFVHRIAGALRAHDDRAQFAAGLDLILAGILSISDQ